MKKMLKIGSWLLFFISVIILMAISNQKVKKQVLADPIIHLRTQDGISILNRKELLGELYASGLFYNGMKRNDFDSERLENFIDSLNEVETADVYLGLDSNWYIDVLTRRPIARIIANGIDQFYIDKHYRIMRLSPYSRPDILSFTDMTPLITNKKVYYQLINNDSLKTKLKLDQIYRISKYVCNDTFYNAQIEQVYYSPKEGFIMVPRVGNQKIIFGDAKTDTMVVNKFKKLTIFYSDVIPYEGWSKYKTINLEYKDQIIATKR